MKFKLIILLLILGAGLISYMIIFEKNEFDIGQKRTDYKLLASELFYTFEEDESVANQRFVGKVIEVSGIISEIQSDQNNETMIVFKEEGEFFGVACTFADPAKTKTLKVGHKITIKGVCQGYLADVVVNNCILIN